MSFNDALAQAGAKPAGKRPYFLAPQVEKVLAITMTLAQELAVVHQRADTLERVLKAKGLIAADEIERFTPDAAASAERQMWNQEFIARVLRIVQQENEAAIIPDEVASGEMAEDMVRDEVMEFDLSVPIVVVGGGACGCIAALAARDAGAEVLLIEADARPMGTTGMSMGVICAAGTRAQAAKGITDSADSLYADIIAKTRGQTDPVIARTLADQSGPTLDWMVERLGLPWELDMGFRPSYGLSTYRMHGWHGHNGQDMVELLHQRLEDEGVLVSYGARLEEIHADADGLVLGIGIRRPDGAIEQVSCGALILASGGFAANQEMLARHIPEMAQARNNGHEGSDGTAVRLGQKLGAAVADMGAYQGYAMLTDPQGISVVPGVIVDGGVIVNARGERFCDESEDIAGMVHPVMAQGGLCWVIYDARIEAAQAYTPDMQALARLHAARCGADAAALAQAIGLPAEALAAALAEAAAAKAAGRADAQGRRWADATPPADDLRALKVVGAIYHTQGGLQIDGAARVLRDDGSALPNLFAGGGAARSVSGPGHWGYLPAMGLCTAVTLGRVAGLAAAALVGAVHPTGE